MSPSSGMWSFRLGWGQSVPHSTRSGNSSTTLRANGNDVAIGAALAVQRRRAGNREALGTGHLAPDVLVLVHEFEKQRELGAVDRLRHVRTAHVVDDDGRRQGGEEVPELRQVDRLEVDDDMPVELKDAPRDLDQLVLRREVDQPLDEIEPHAAHARLMKPLQLGVARRRA